MGGSSASKAVVAGKWQRLLLAHAGAVCGTEGKRFGVEVCQKALYTLVKFI